MLGAAQRESLSLWLPGLGPQVTECDMPPESGALFYPDGAFLLHIHTDQL